jgi:hypothetical protein
MGLRVIFVSVVLPSLDFVAEGLLVGDAAIETLARQGRELRFGHFQPASVFGPVMPFETVDETLVPRSDKGFVEGSRFVGVEIVSDQQDLLLPRESVLRPAPCEFGYTPRGYGGPSP